MMVQHIDGSKRVHFLWPTKYCVKAGTNLYSLTCKLLHENKNKSDHKNNITRQSSNDNIILEPQIMACDGFGSQSRISSRN